jgi:hypothetical protein
MKNTKPDPASAGGGTKTSAITNSGHQNRLRSEFFNTLSQEETFRVDNVLALFRGAKIPVRRGYFRSR